MFTEIFTMRQKRVFLAVAEELLLIENDIEERKTEEYLINLCKEMRLMPEEKEPCGPEETAAFFDSEEARRTLIVECVLLASVNGEFSDGERLFISDLMRGLSLEPSLLPDILNDIRPILEGQENLLGLIYGG